MDRRELEQLFAFDRWANRQTLAALRSIERDAAPDLVGLFRHVLSACDMWLSRIDGTEPLEPFTREGSTSIEDVASYLEGVDAKSLAFVEALPEARLGEEFAYRNTFGAPFTNGVGDMLQHVILHGVEHRAQVMWEVGKLGGEPVELEYAWFLREPPSDA